jgi:uncharacterized protein (DUF2235 family)
MASEKERHEVQLEGAETPRNLLIFLDGTWNDENGRNNDGVVTNIYKLFSSLTGSLEDERIPHVRTTAKNIGLYFRGVGNDEDNIKAKGFYQGAFGAGERNIRDHAYASICKYYQPGDRICLFGFSRGASSARLLASKLNEHGLPREITLHYREAVNATSGEKEWMFTKYDAREEENSKKVDVDFLGIFDTVGAFGIPINLGPLNFQKINLFRDLTLSPNIRRAVHLVAIDESREPFVPTLANVSDQVEEVWFPGVHADIGGGYPDCLLGNITLNHMVQELHATIESPDVTFSSAIAKHLNYDLGSDEFILHYHGDGLAKGPRRLHVLKSEKPTRLPVKIHKSALALREQDNFYYSERFNSFSTKIRIGYDPINLKQVDGNLVIV